MLFVNPKQIAPNQRKQSDVTIENLRFLASSRVFKASLRSASLRSHAASPRFLKNAPNRLERPKPCETPPFSGAHRGEGTRANHKGFSRARAGVGDCRHRFAAPADELFAAGSGTGSLSWSAAALAERCPRQQSSTNRTSADVKEISHEQEKVIGY